MTPNPSLKRTVTGQVFRFSGFVSDEGSLNASRSADEHYVIVTYWRSFEEHERSHTDAAKSRLNSVAW